MPDLVIQYDLNDYEENMLCHFVFELRWAVSVAIAEILDAREATSFDFNI
jgi:hypothetical protein